MNVVNNNAGASQVTCNVY